MKKMTNSPVDDANREERLRMQEEMRRAFSIFSGKWKLEILWMLHGRVHRFGELKRAIPGITQHVLTAQLRELEADGLVSRQVFAEVPPRVEYALTSAALDLAPVMDALVTWYRRNRSGD